MATNLLLENEAAHEGYDLIYLQRARDLAEGRSLAPLPPGAMHVKGSRSRTAPGPADDELLE